MGTVSEMETRECLEWGALLRETAGGSGDGVYSVGMLPIRV